MLFFECDYGEGAHEEILKKLMETNREQLPGYGSDRYCESAKEKIREACQCENAEVSLLVGGTQTNQIVIDALLQPYEGVIAAQTGHINVHEAGAIEFTGHKVLPLSQKEGKINSQELRVYLENFWQDETHEHMVFPGMVYLSHPTEYGTLYSRKELREIHGICKEYHIPLYVDGARLGYGLMAEGADISLPFLAANCDVFYIGGTKIGALCGEAVVFTGWKEPKYFMTRIKQHGALLAKGRLVGIQFDTLFTDELYFKISRNAIEMANRLKEGLRQKNYSFYLDSPTNQQFIVLKNQQMEQLAKEVSFSIWEKADEDHTVIRLATSWATRKEDVDRLLQLL